MMTKIKYALSFMFGAVYSWALIYVINNPVREASNPIIIPALFIIIFGGIGIFISMFMFIVNNWDKP